MTMIRNGWVRKILFFFVLSMGFWPILLGAIESYAETSEILDLNEFTSDPEREDKNDLIAQSKIERDKEEEETTALEEEEIIGEKIPDPLEPLNRIFFHINDRLYFWALKPIATGYKKFFPEAIRRGVSNFFSNVATPVRLVNCLFQANLKGAGLEALRFLINTPLGLGGFFDTAQKEFGIEKREEDLGQTFGVWGIGPGVYLEWPLLGSSNLRDTFGYVGDLFLDPITYIPSIPVRIGLKTYDKINETSLLLGEYENFKKIALDPYVAKRDAYFQNRKYKIQERK
ncbi:MAG: MlaA family lipoprotein [Thermodesulfobacteriota bacterium]